MDSMTQDTILFVIGAALIGWILWLIYKRQQHRTELQARHFELFNRTVDKFGTSQEFVSFLQSKEGQTMLYAQTPAKQAKWRTQLRFIQVGIILILIGVAFLLNAMQYVGNPDINFIHKVEDFRFWGVLSIGSAFGLFIIAFVTNIWERKHNGSNGE